MGMPPAQHSGGDFAGNGADRRAAPDPARGRIADPGLAIGFAHVFDIHAADLVAEIVILCGGNCMRRIGETELLDAREKALMMLAPEHTKHEFCRLGRAAACHQRHDKAGEVGVIEVGDRVPGFEFAAVSALAHYLSDQAGGGTVVFTDSRCIIFSWKASSFGNALRQPQSGKRKSR